MKVERLCVLGATKLKNLNLGGGLKQGRYTEVWNIGVSVEAEDDVGQTVGALPLGQGQQTSLSNGASVHILK